MKPRGRHAAQRRRRLSAALAVAILLILPARAATASDLPKWASASVAASREATDAALQVFPDAETVQILWSEEMEVDRENCRSIVLREVYQVRQGSGGDIGQIAFSESDDTRLQSIRIWRKDASGRVEEFHKPAVSQEGGELYSDDKKYVVGATGIGAGATVAREVVYRSARRDVWVDDLPAHQDFPVLRWEYRLRLPAGWQAQAFWSDYDSATLTPAPPPALDEECRVWTRERIGVATEEEPFAPTDSRLAPVFLVRYGPAAELPMDAWPEIADWYAAYSVTGLEGRESLREEVAHRIEGATTREERIARVAEFVRASVRYVQIYLGDGGYRPHPAAAVFRNRFGDCKDMAHLAVAMLDLAGVRAFPVLAQTWSRNRVWREFPSQGFDHCIVAIESEGPAAESGYLFFDPTAKCVPVGRLPTGLDGSAALVIDGKPDGRLIELPAMNAPENGTATRGVIALEPGLGAVATIEQIRFGHAAHDTRDALRDDTAEEREQWVARGLRDSFAGAKILSLDYPDLDRISDTLTIRFTARIPQAGRPASGLLLLQPDFLTARAALLFPRKERSRPVSFASLERAETALEIRLPEEWTAESIPAPARFENQVGSYQRSYEVEDGVVRLRRVEELRSRTVPASRYSLVQDWDRAIVEGDRQRLALRMR